MGTSLTPEFWERFAVLLVLGAGLTCVLAAVFEEVAVRLLRGPVHGTRPQAPSPSRPERRQHGVSVHP